MADTRLTFKGTDYRLDLDKELTVGRLRKIKSIFGPELGRYGSFYRAFADMDPEALLCVVWIAQQAAGEADAPATPNEVAEFNMTEFVLAPVEDEDAKEADPTESPEARATPSPSGSKATPRSSTPATSDS